MLPLASVVTVLWIGLAVLIGSLIVGGTAVFFFRARLREAIESELNPQAAQGPSEVRMVGEQIERALREQRLQGETQRQILAQKLDSVRQSVDAQRTLVDGLQSELRHEVRRRDAEMEQVRQQLGAIQATAALPPRPTLALPAHEDAAPAEAAPQTPPPPVTQLTTTPAPAPAESAAEAPSAFGSIFEEVSFVPAVSEAPPPAASDVPDEPHRPDEPAATSLFAEVAFPPASGDGQSAPVAEPPEAPVGPSPVEAEPEISSHPAEPAEVLPLASPDEFFGPAPDAFPTPLDLDEPEAGDGPVDGAPAADAPAETDAPEASEADEAPEAAPASAPEGADDLTVISTIDEEMQERLYAEGVTTLDAIACWSRSDARRIGAAIDVPEDTIMNRWVFEAQAAAFDAQ